MRVIGVLIAVFKRLPNIHLESLGKGEASLAIAKLLSGVG
jgi:hypothetical protein